MKNENILSDKDIEKLKTTLVQIDALTRKENNKEKAYMLLGISEKISLFLAQTADENEIKALEDGFRRRLETLHGKFVITPLEEEVLSKFEKEYNRHPNGRERQLIANSARTRACSKSGITRYMELYQNYIDETSANKAKKVELVK